MRRFTLPAQATSFIGRHDELAAIESLLGEASLVTLTGAGGCGKTRLALEGARRLQDRFPDGVRLVELAELTATGQVPQAVAAALDLQAEEATVGRIATFLASRNLLLILDNCEHLIEGCAHLVDSLLRQAPDLKVLATSRQALAVPWERVLVISPLEAAAEGVELFLDRARAIRPDFALTPAVERICQRLDGLPLAIELAAARVRTLTPEQIEERLDQAIPFLHGANRVASPRQQTLRATIDWSYNLLSEAERALFRRLGLFQGHFSLAAAEAVSGEPGTLDLLGALIEQSLVVANPPRFRLLEPLRQYALGLLEEAGEAEGARSAHLAYVLALVTEAQPHLQRAEQGEWLDRLEAERLNIRQALAWSLEHQPEAGLHIVAGLLRFWRLRGSHAEGRQWADRLLAVAKEPTAARGWGLIAAGRLGPHGDPYFKEAYQIFGTVGDRLGRAWAAWGIAAEAHYRGDRQGYEPFMAEARSLFAAERCGEGEVHCLQGPGLDPAQRLHAWEACVADLRASGDKATLIRALRAVIELDRFWHESEQSDALVVEALQLAQAVGDRVMLADLQLLWGSIARRAGRFAEANTCYAEALAMHERVGNDHGMLSAQAELGKLALEMGEGARAHALFSDLLAAAKRLGYDAWHRTAAVFLGIAHLQAGQWAQAEAYLDEAVAAARGVCESGTQVWGLRTKALLQAERGQLAAALRLQRESLQIECDNCSKPRGLAIGVAMVGALLIHNGEIPSGLRLLAAAEAVDPVGQVLDPLEKGYWARALGLAREALGAKYEAVWAEGAHLTLAEAVVEGLHERQGRPGGLTAREYEVVQLVAQGLTDREIAAHLVISPRTVDTHLRRIFQKVGVTSRTALATWTLREG